MPLAVVVHLVGPPADLSDAPVAPRGGVEHAQPPVTPQSITGSHAALSDILVDHQDFHEYWWRNEMQLSKNPPGNIFFLALFIPGR